MLHAVQERSFRYTRVGPVRGVEPHRQSCERQADRCRRRASFGFAVRQRLQSTRLVALSLIPLGDGSLTLLNCDLSLLNGNRRRGNRADQERC